MVKNMCFDIVLWKKQMLGAGKKKTMPILSFPSIHLLGVTVRELITCADKQADGICAIADRVDSGAAVSFMDLSVEAECFGTTIHFSDDEVPAVTSACVRNMPQAEALEIPVVGSGRSGICLDAIRKVKQRIFDRPVFAGMIGPFSLAARLMDVSEIMMDCYDDPDMVQLVVEKATTFLIEMANAYKAAGADGIIMAEPVAGLLSPALEAEFSAPFCKRIVDAVQDDSFLLIYHNCGNGAARMLKSIFSIGAAGYHFGNAVDMQQVLENAPKEALIMGNVDPVNVIQRGDPQSVVATVHQLMEQCCSYDNFVVSSGCDIPPLTEWENIEVFFKAVEDWYCDR